MNHRRQSFGNVVRSFAAQHRVESNIVERRLHGSRRTRRTRLDPDAEIVLVVREATRDDARDIPALELPALIVDPEGDATRRRYVMIEPYTHNGVQKHGLRIATASRMTADEEFYFSRPLSPVRSHEIDEARRSNVCDYPEDRR